MKDQISGEEQQQARPADRSIQRSSWRRRWSIARQAIVIRRSARNEATTDSIIARWTKILGFSTIALVFVTGVNAGILYFTDHKIAHQLEIMKGQLRLAEVDERPWLRVAVESFDMAKGENGLIDIDTRMRLFNSGKSPGLRVQSAFDLVPYDLDKARSQQEGLCRQAKQSVPRDFYPTIFPDASGTPPNYAAWSFNKLVDELQTLREKNSTNITPVLLGCVVYRFVTDDIPHHTRFAVQVGSAGGSRLMPIDVDKLPLKAADVRLQQPALLPDIFD